MNAEKRQKFIENFIMSGARVEIKTLSNELNVSEMTIRRDLRKLEEQGLIKRVFKGTELDSIKNSDLIDDSLKKRIVQNTEEKKLIGKIAATFVKDGDIIALDASTTVYEMCKHLKDKKITIITNSIRVCLYFSMVKNVDIILAGGNLRYGTLSLIGPDVGTNFRKYYTNKIFISGKALSYENKLTDINAFEIETKKALIENTKEVFVLLDHSKLNKTSLIKACDLKNISKLIIDGMKEFSDQEEKVIQKIKNEGVEVIIA
ncbi:DeoR family myo-inositol catabolism operon transcriptional repressor [Sporomusaceae bacterium BoRhaA]|uniref:DeoR/GlpR family DNA-binding transcription regulator n=1 Tax=Pelorhabdus rhamnosifermentans TaxID=2772457 RepID=UPI001C060416|nr:DeoR/GlpR family DNA-binding transcription regulator [Pelorhabdus rhamnosifermentans]MBU2699267.1 DeoR family myo-inositol catabolism operon transcriptional repressor [Pelorhabdus rhamnosifermentans]